MRVGAFEILLFFVCLNLSFFIINETAVLPYSVEAIESPEHIKTMTYARVIAAITTLIAGLGISAIFKKYTLGTTLTLILATLSVLYDPIVWIYAGFPLFLQKLGVPTPFWTVIGALISIVLFWFLIGIVSQRYMER